MSVSLAKHFPSNDIFLCIGSDSDTIDKFFAKDYNQDQEDVVATDE